MRNARTRLQSNGFDRSTPRSAAERDRRDRDVLSICPLCRTYGLAPARTTRSETGTFGTGKSVLLDELARRGYQTIDTDYDGYTVRVDVNTPAPVPTRGLPPASPVQLAERNITPACRAAPTV
jgi:hypothetical protein